MPLNLASPGVVVREVDLTIGRIDPTSTGIGAIAAPFAKGPIGVPLIIQNEEELRQNFGDPYSIDKHYESWMTASSYLAYGGSLRVVRTDGTLLANAKYGESTSDIKLNSIEDYNNKGYDENTISDVVVAAKNPGSWANGLKVCIVDSKADQILTLNDSIGVSVGLGITQVVPTGATKIGAGTTELLDGYFKGIVTVVDSTTNAVSVKFISHVSAAGTETPTDYTAKGTYKFDLSQNVNFYGSGVGSTSFVGSRGALGSTVDVHASGTPMSSFYLVTSTSLDMSGGVSLGSSVTDTTVGISTVGISTGADRFLLIGNELISLSSASIGNGQITSATRASEGTSIASHSDGSPVKYLQKFASVALLTSSITASTISIGINTTRTGLSTVFNSGGFVDIENEFIQVSSFLSGANLEKTVVSQLDWYDQQTFEPTTSTNITRSWSSIAPRPQTSNFADSRSSRFDEFHLLVIDSDGKVTGNEGTILEKHLNLSKAKDALYSAGSPSYWRSYLAENSQYIFGGSEPAGITTTGFSSGFTPLSDINWDQDTDGITFGSIGSLNMPLSGGKNYNGNSNLTSSGALSTDLADLSESYELFKNVEEFKIDFLIMGAANYEKEKAQALAGKLIEVAEDRKDAIAFISPYRLAFLNDSTIGEVTVNSAATITDRIIEFYSAVPSSSYAVFDSGYKYMYDRFNRTFRYIPLNGDIAGLCARNDANNFPWFSPAGTVRGSILNAVKLAYNPTQAQRDVLYTNRINPVIFSPGGGIVLFGDKTGLNKASAFDRINVRRLFIFLENAISSAAKDQLFEFNDDITRNNFVNIVEPFLRDVQAKRGIQDFRVICDETNNTASVIDNNEFIADIYIKPSRSINYIGLTFVATRSGISFEEIIGNV